MRPIAALRSAGLVAWLRAFLGLKRLPCVEAVADLHCDSPEVGGCCAESLVENPLALWGSDYASEPLRVGVKTLLASLRACALVVGCAMECREPSPRQAV